MTRTYDYYTLGMEMDFLGVYTYDSLMDKIRAYVADDTVDCYTKVVLYGDDNTTFEIKEGDRVLTEADRDLRLAVDDIDEIDGYLYVAVSLT